jgi:multisubunit Na+/H+ antiporter MnhC subunit
MALHAPVHQLGVAPHPHALRNALIVVGLAILAVILIAAALLYKPTPSTSTLGDRLTTQEMVDFRAGERAVGYPFVYNGPH